MLLDVKDVSKDYGKERAIANLSFTLAAGEICGVLGPDGAGKTTLLRLIVGLLSPTEGRINRKGLLGYVPQEFGLYEEMSIRENLFFFGQLHGMDKKKIRERMEELLAWTGLAPFVERQAGYLSGGMKRKLEMAVAMLHEPELLVLDEPTNGVDPVSRQEVWQMITRIGKAGTGVLVSTQYLEEARYCNRVLFLEKGSLLQEAVPSTLIQDFPYKVVAIREAFRSRGRFSDVLLSEQGVIDVYTRGADLVVICEDPEVVDVLAREEEDVVIEEVAPSFEDIFIHALQQKRGEIP